MRVSWDVVFSGLTHHRPGIVTWWMCGTVRYRIGIRFTSIMTAYRGDVIVGGWSCLYWLRKEILRRSIASSMSSTPASGDVRLSINWFLDISLARWVPLCHLSVLHCPIWASLVCVFRIYSWHHRFSKKVHVTLWRFISTPKRVESRPEKTWVIGEAKVVTHTLPSVTIRITSSLTW
jgi:hypothetical protein